MYPHPPARGGMLIFRLVYNDLRGIGLLAGLILRLTQITHASSDYLAQYPKRQSVPLQLSAQVQAP
jgi:hypothetical protein